MRPHCSAAFAIAEEAGTRVALVLEADEEHDDSAPAVIDAVRRRLAAELEVQLDVAAVCRPGSVPKTTSGKVQRRLCGAMLSREELDVVAQWRRAA